MTFIFTTVVYIAIEEDDHGKLIVSTKIDGDCQNHDTIAKSRNIPKLEEVSELGGITIDAACILTSKQRSMHCL